MTEPAVYSEIKDTILWVYLNRPERLNALNQDLVNGLRKELQDHRDNSDVRVVVFRGIGKAFCSGADLKERKDMSEADTEEFVNLLRKTFFYIFKYPKPTIACINGFAYGGGLELAMACDLRVSVESTMIGLTETSLGIIPGAGGTQYLSHLLGLAKAKEMIFCATKMEAIEALHFGLINKLYTKESLDEKTQFLGKKIARNAPLAVQAAKKALNSGFKDFMEKGLKTEGKSYGTVLSSEDRIEGLNAFKEKRTPRFRGK